MKAHSGSKNLSDAIKDLGEIISARVNSTGTKVSISVAQTSLVPDSKLYIWDTETDTITYFNFASGQFVKLRLISLAFYDRNGKLISPINDLRAFYSEHDPANRNKS